MIKYFIGIFLLLTFSRTNSQDIKLSFNLTISPVNPNQNVTRDDYEIVRNNIHLNSHKIRNICYDKARKIKWTFSKKNKFELWVPRVKFLNLIESEKLKINVLLNNIDGFILKNKNINIKKNKYEYLVEVKIGSKTEFKLPNKIDTDKDATTISTDVSELISVIKSLKDEVVNEDDLKELFKEFNKVQSNIDLYFRGIYISDREKDFYYYIRKIKKNTELFTQNSENLRNEIYAKWSQSLEWDRDRIMRQIHEHIYFHNFKEAMIICALSEDEDILSSFEDLKIIIREYYNITNLKDKISNIEVVRSFKFTFGKERDLSKCIDDDIVSLMNFTVARFKEINFSRKNLGKMRDLISKTFRSTNESDLVEWFCENRFKDFSKYFERTYFYNDKSLFGESAEEKWQTINGYLAYQIFDSIDNHSNIFQSFEVNGKLWRCMGNTAKSNLNKKNYSEIRNIIQNRLINK